MMSRLTLPIIILSGLTGVVAVILIFAQWGNQNEFVKRTSVMCLMLSMVSVSIALMLCLILLSEYYIKHIMYSSIFIWALEAAILVLMLQHI